MKMLATILGLTLSSLTAMADQQATITCTGSQVTLTQKSPYLGEDSKYAQSLFVLKRTGADESADAAYFLKIETRSANVIVGKNEKGGRFTLKTDAWKNTGDGTTIQEEATGTLTYSHGPLRGTDEAVNCVRQ
ncbi:MAG: hypothetical protein EOP06_30405 [Proteobacteria bacterium]|nr:MAG: hypothetical protein EOP06_30405 [Pseudomonadota bacterium]